MLLATVFALALSRVVTLFVVNDGNRPVFVVPERPNACARFILPAGAPYTIVKPGESQLIAVRIACQNASTRLLVAPDKAKFDTCVFAVDFSVGRYWARAPVKGIPIGPSRYSAPCFARRDGDIRFLHYESILTP